LTCLKNKRIVSAFGVFFRIIGYFFLVIIPCFFYDEKIFRVFSFFIIRIVVFFRIILIFIGVFLPILFTLLSIGIDTNT